MEWDKETSDKEVDYVFKNYYFKLNKNLQIHVGLWPYDSFIPKLARRIVFYITFILTTIPLLNGSRIWCGVNVDLCGENLIGIIYCFTITSKFFIACIYEKNFKSIYERVAQNWLEITDPKEHAILQDYARQGRIKTVGYLIYMTTAGFLFMHLPLTPLIMDILIPLNESRQLTLFVKGEFIIDPFENYGKLYVLFSMCTAASVLSVTSIDTTYTVIIHQILGIFSIVKYRLHLATISFDQLKDVSYDIIVKAIQLHNQAIQFVELMDTSYRTFFFIIIGVTVMFISSAVVLITVNTARAVDCLRLSVVLIGMILHFLFMTWPGQKVIDHSHELFRGTFANEWYNISEKSKTLIKVIMLRCLRPNILTAGGLYVMNLENFGSIMKTAVSYIAVISSFR